MKKPRLPSIRQLKVGEIVKHALATLFLRDELAEPLFVRLRLTISEVKISPDLNHASIFYTCWKASDEEKKHLETLLTFYTPDIRHKLAQAVILRNLPVLYFKYDVLFDHVNKIESLLVHVKNDSSSLDKE